MRDRNASDHMRNIRVGMKNFRQRVNEDVKMATKTRKSFSK